MKYLKYTKYVIQGLLVVILALLVYGGLSSAIPKAQPILKATADTAVVPANQKETIHYVAVGDSLTEGIGDQTARGGFVPLLANDLQERYKLTTVEIDNFGVAGDRSDQILKRVKQDKIAKNLKTADVVTLTVGGNDLMKVIQDNFFGLSIKSFTRPRAKYQKRVAELIDEIRKDNPEVPIYLLGIYNPFYLNFPEITDMQTVVDDWNAATEETAAEYDRVHFIPINELLYQGIGEQTGITSELTSSEEAEVDSETKNSSDIKTVDNNVLSDGDKFHPNNTGYQLMANAVRDEMIKTRDEWLEKGK